MTRGMRFVILPVWLLLGLLLAAPVRAATPAGPLGRTLNDAEIRRAVEDRFLLDEAVSLHPLDVSVMSGVVTLRGTVGSIAERERAVMVAQSLRGVRSVVDRMELTPVARTDDEIRWDVEQALVSDPAADSYEIDVIVDDGTVTLVGTVDSWQEKQLARRVAQAVRGVRGIRNEIAVEYKTQRPDPEVKAEIERRLAWDARVDAESIDVGVSDGKVELTGAVGSAYERRLVTEDSWVGGVKEVDSSGLWIEWWARDEAERQTAPDKTDQEIARAIEDALRYDPRVHSFKLEVSVRDGVATLSGAVDNLEALLAAERDARNTVGVELVLNRLRVQPRQSATEAELEQRVARALRLDPAVDRFAIDVTVYDGRAYLGGTVESCTQRTLAETNALLAGAVAVRNELRLADGR